MPPGGSLKAVEGFHITRATLRLYHKKKNVGCFYDIGVMLKESRAAERASHSGLASTAAKKEDTTCIKAHSPEIPLSSQVDVVHASAVSSATQLDLRRRNRT